MTTAKKTSRNVEVSVHLVAAFKRACEAAGVVCEKTYTNGGVTAGFNVRGDAETVRKLILRYRY